MTETRMGAFERCLTANAAGSRVVEPDYLAMLNAPDAFVWLCGQRPCFICGQHTVCGHREPAVLRAELIALGMRREPMAKGPQMETEVRLTA